MSAVPRPDVIPFDELTAETTTYSCATCHRSGMRVNMGHWSLGPIVCRHFAANLTDEQLALACERLTA